MGHYDDCREAANWVDRKREAYGYYDRELAQLGSAIELIKAIANGHEMYATTTPRSACDKWLMDNGYECEATRAAQKAKKRAEIDEKIRQLEEERKELDK